ncbi:MAG: insulinase family protein, partial [Acidaminobacteraceae bacterium]
MDYLIGSTYNGFKLLKKYNINEIDSEVMLFEHEFSGARLMNVSNDDDNKVFSIGFRTPPSDDCGAPHIVEHCVLSGSRKYSTKEPFMDMVKGSMNTFINAMTFSDKTLYPVASKNTKDFYNLMDVYLDAVLYPKIYEIEDIFMQEGWHYDIHAADEDIIYKGVVYNEMKGAYSNPLSLFRDQIAASLYPDTCYKYSSGGDPDHITDLTYEEFLNFHKKYYHPSNSYIYLYGDGNVNELLKYIDTNYLSEFERDETNSEIVAQTPITTSVNSHRVYPISDDDETDGKDYLAISFNLGETTDTEINLMSQILGEMLIESSASPLKKALLESDIAKDILAPGNDGLYRAFSIIAKDTSMARKDEFISIVKNSLRDMVNKGIDKKLILSSINVVEYSLREAENFATKGIIYNINSLDSWLYDGDEAAPLRYNETLAKLRAGIDTGYFENFINDKILNNPHQSICAMTPKKGVLDEKKSRDAIKLAEYKGSLSEDEINELILKNAALKKKQLSVDSPEALATIPKLTREDVSEETVEIDSSIVYDDKYQILYNNVFTNSISYIDLVFDMSHIKTEDIYYVSMLSNLIGELSTYDNSYEDLSNLVLLNTGGISLNPTVYTKYKNSTVYYPKLVVNSKAIGTSTKEMLSLVSEIISKTEFDDIKRIKDILSKVKSQT